MNGSSRTNPIDPLSVGLSASSLAYFLAVARDLKSLRRSNPSVSARVAKIEAKLRAAHQAYMRANPIILGDEIAMGAGAAVGAAVGSAVIQPVIKAVSKHMRKKNPMTATQTERLNGFLGKIDALDGRIAKTRSWSKNHKNLVSRREKLIDKVDAIMEKAHRTNPTLLVASNPTTKRSATKRRISKPREHAGDPDYEAALTMYGHFFGGDDPVEVIEVEAPEGTPKYLVALGEAPEVTYKPPDHTSKKGVPFVHKFAEEGGTKPFLATDSTGDFLGYVGGSFFITPEGIRD